MTSSSTAHHRVTPRRTSSPTHCLRIVRSGLGLEVCCWAATRRRGASARSGRAVRPSWAPEKPLELWSFEACPFCRLAREALCELEIRYVLHNVAKGSPRRDAFVARSGKGTVPYLADPNTGREMFETADIVRYLNAAYGKLA